jgi:hypothetical protein
MTTESDYTVEGYENLLADPLPVGRSSETDAEKADFQKRCDEADAHIMNEKPLPKPGPRPQSISVSVRRVIQPKQYESLEFSMAATCEVDPDMTLGINLEKVTKLLTSKVDWAVAIWTGTHPEGR